jgi:hypothetical protein
MLEPRLGSGEPRLRKITVFESSKLEIPGFILRPLFF